MSENSRPRRHRITIVRKVTIPTGNFWIWRRVCQTWAEIHENVITIRFQKNLFPGMHVLAGDDRFEITAVIDRPGKTRITELHIEKLRASADLSDAQW
jgi:hypothetical protein